MNRRRDDNTVKIVLALTFICVGGGKLYLSFNSSYDFWFFLWAFMLIFGCINLISVFITLLTKIKFKSLFLERSGRHKDRVPPAF